MKKILGILLMSVIVVFGITSCKSKQKAVEISGAKIEAKQTTPTATQATSTTVAEATPVEEVTRNEKFSLADGETNSAAFSNKYHVVVGSFSIKQNAKNLQSTLIKEGNNALVVVNEKGMFRVLIASYNEYYQAKNRINEISNRFPDAWVLVQK
ncbi:Sporulation domain-containing protein [uncultured Paludibacter sp.]|uniref:Sporulation domain-containing protein n=1 Tax=uncultured Paludibacter sp. TaxID=497635 RepID=A0A653AFE2_9BACT|nr:Sporulation domain-containing protein [uncultured Paludibacter sp.]